MKPKSILITGILAVALGSVARAQSIDIDIHLGRHAPPPPPEVVAVVPDHGPVGPAPWEHGHWYHRTQAYYFYPAGDAYYRPADHVWFYLDRGEWRSSRMLPDSVHVDFGRSVALNMATDRPYEFHRQVMARYPRDYFGARVRLRSEERHEHDRDDRRHDDDHDHGHDRDHDSRNDSKDRDNRH